MLWVPIQRREWNAVIPKAKVPISVATESE